MLLQKNRHIFNYHAIMLGITAVGGIMIIKQRLIPILEP